VTILHVEVAWVVRTWSNVGYQNSLHLEDRGNKAVRNVGISHYYTASQPEDSDLNLYLRENLMSRSSVDWYFAVFWNSRLMQLRVEVQPAAQLLAADVRYVSDLRVS